MCEYKRPIAILCCCASLLPAKQAHAFWPVLDFGEIIPIVSNVTTTLDSLSQAKEQLKQLEDAIRAIGESIDTINQFSQDLRKNIQDMTGIINDIQDTVNIIPGVDADFGNITDTLNQANEMQSGFAGSLTDQTNNVLNQTTNMNNKISSGIDSAQSAAHKAQDSLNKANKSDEEGEETEEGKDGQNKENNLDIKEEIAEKEEDTEKKKDFWDKVKDKSEQVSDLTEDANKALDQVDKTGLIDTGDIRDTINSVNNNQENIVDLADTSKSGYEDLKGEVDKAKDEKLLDELKDKYTGKDSGDLLDKLDKASDDLSSTAENVSDALGKVDETGLVDTGDIQDTINSVNNKQEDINDLANFSKEGLGDLKDEIDKAKDEGLMDTLKDKYTGENSGNLIDKIKQGSEDLSDVAENVEKALDKADKEGGIDTGGIGNTIEKVNEKQEDLSGKAEDAEKAYNKAKDKYNEYREKKQQKKEQEEQKEKEEASSESDTGNVPVEEEEEEEEVSEYSAEEAAEEMKLGFDTVKDESRKVAERVNDSFDASISTLNQTAQKSLDVFARLEKALAGIDGISAEEKTKLQERLAKLKKEQQDVSDRAIAVMEAVKDNYNLEYQDKVADGISNYEKLVNEFLRGNTSKEMVFAAGEQLKKEISGINVMPDKGILDEINRREAKVKEDLIILTEDIKKANQQ